MGTRLKVGDIRRFRTQKREFSGVVVSVEQHHYSVYRLNNQIVPVSKSAKVKPTQLGSASQILMTHMSKQLKRIAIMQGRY